MPVSFIVIIRNVLLNGYKWPVSYYIINTCLLNGFIFVVYIMINLTH